MAVRYVLMSTHYRQPLNFTLDGVHAAKESIRRLRDFRQRLREAAAPQDNPELDAALERGRKGFEDGIADDLNTSAALAALFDMVRDVNKLDLSAADGAKAAALLERFDSVMGVLGEEKEEILDQEVEALIRQREEARRNRDFKEADAVRDRLKSRGILLEDLPDGTHWKRA